MTVIEKIIELSEKDKLRWTLNQAYIQNKNTKAYCSYNPSGKMPMIQVRDDPFSLVIINKAPESAYIKEITKEEFILFENAVNHINHSKEKEFLNMINLIKQI